MALFSHTRHEHAVWEVFKTGHSFFDWELLNNQQSYIEGINSNTVHIRLALRELLLSFSAMGQ